MSAVPVAPRPAGPPAGLRRLVLRLGRSRLFRTESAGPPVTPSEERERQAAALLAVLDAAVAEQAPTDRAVAACGGPGQPPPELAGLLARQSVHYARLAGWLEALPADGDLAGVRDLAVRLVAYHQWMLHQSTNLAFAVHHRPGSEAARQRISGLGAPADRLRALRDALRSDSAM